VLDQEVLILKGRSVDRLATRPIEPLKVTALQHELGDDPVEDCVLVREALLVLTRGNCHKVCHGTRYNLVEQFHVDDSIVFIVCRNSELNLGSLGLLLLLLALWHWCLRLLELPLWLLLLLELLLLLKLLLLLLELLLSLRWLSLLLLLLLSKESPDLVVSEALLP